jgi:hypothetical protein
MDIQPNWSLGIVLPFGGARVSGMSSSIRAMTMASSQVSVLAWSSCKPVTQMFCKGSDGVLHQLDRGCNSPCYIAGFQ